MTTAPIHIPYSTNLPGVGVGGGHADWESDCRGREPPSRVVYDRIPDVRCIPRRYSGHPGNIADRSILTHPSHHTDGPYRIWIYPTPRVQYLPRGVIYGADTSSRGAMRP